MIPWQIKDRLFPPPKFCYKCGCPMVEIIVTVQNKRFDEQTGKGVQKKRRAMKCATCRKKYADDYGWYYNDYFYEFGPTWTEEVRSECE